MAEYRCDFIGIHDGVIGYVLFDAKTDNIAYTIAADLTTKHHLSVTFELWQGERPVTGYTRKRGARLVHVRARLQSAAGSTST